MTELSSGPELLIIAGPNGAGKTTFVNTFLPEYTNVREFVNADLIAKGISPFEPEGALIEAGKTLLTRVNQLIEAKTSFAFETTLSGKGYINLIRRAKENGYFIKLYFIYLNSTELSIKRIQDRVLKGGHNVPKEITIRRYTRSLANFFHLYQPLADEWQFFDNSSSIYRPLALFREEETIEIDFPLYQKIKRTYER